MTLIQLARCTAVAALVGAQSVMAQSAIITLPDVSQHARITQRIGLTDLTIDYHRPLVAGRKIFGGLQPYGEIWRAGANYNTVFDVTDPVRIDGQPLARGTYGVHMIPGPSSWVVVFSKNSTSWGSFSYDSTEDALRVRVSPRQIPHLETLTYSFDEPTARSVVVTMAWDNLAVPIHIDVDVPHIVADNLRLQLRGRVQTEWQAWEEAANYLVENGLDAQAAADYADRSIAIEERFENEITKARALRSLGRTAAADSAQAKALRLGNQSQVYQFARTLQRLGQQRAALDIFEQDIRRFPGTSTSHLEAARIAVAKGNFATAITETRQAIALASPAMKGALEGVLAELQQGVDINR